MKKIPLIFVTFLIFAIVYFSVQKHNHQNYKDGKCIPELKEEPKKAEDPPLVPWVIDTKKIYHYAEGLELAKKANYQVLVIFGAEWCHWCKKLEKDTIPNIEFKNIVVVHVDEKEEEIVQKYKEYSGGLPYYIMIDTNEKVLKSGRGYKTVPQFKKWMISQSNEAN